LSREGGVTCKKEIISYVLEKYSYLSLEQKEGVIRLKGESNFGILVGKVGAGKTTTMRVVSEIYRESGARVI
jgi:ABC-type proline/glycine betaine transport system ATPase subunit